MMVMFLTNGASFLHEKCLTLKAEIQSCVLSQESTERFSVSGGSDQRVLLERKSSRNLQRGKALSMLPADGKQDH